MSRSRASGRSVAVPVTVGPGAAVTLALLALLAGLAVLPAQAPGASTTAYAVAGLICAAAILAALLAGEVATARMARRAGQQVDRVGLWRGFVPDPEYGWSATG